MIVPANRGSRLKLPPSPGAPMKTVLMLATLCLLVVAGCSSNGGTDGDDADAMRTAIVVGDAASQQDKDLCEWLAKLIADVNAGAVLGTASAQGQAVGETRYRINNMYGLSLGAHEPIPSAVNALMTKTRGAFEFEEVREEMNALRDACAEFGLETPELQ